MGQVQAASSVETAESRTVLYRELKPGGSGGHVFRLDQPIVITIDGPAGTGKSSVARALARRLGLDFLDTGAMYRAAAAISIDRGIPMKDAARLVEEVKQADLHFDWSKDPPEILAWGGPMNARIRDADVTAIVSPVSAIPTLRQHMVAKQRLMAKQHPRLVSEGRDQGSVVFPDASVKFYLDASAQVRAMRRAQQLRASGVAADETQLLADIIARDKSDMGRADGPLVLPAGGVVLDTSSLDFVQVVDELERIVRKKAAEP
jgi:cytidylate kinase